MYSCIYICVTMRTLSTNILFSNQNGAKPSNLMELSFKHFLTMLEDQSAQGLMGTSGTISKQPKPSDLAGKNKIDNSGCRGGPGVRRGGSSACPDIDPSGESGGPGVKAGGGGAAPAAAAPK
jgi:hypothetical protein